MNAWFGWALAAAALFIGWRSYGWPGVALALSVIVFWLLLQFSRSVRVMRGASESPVGHVDSAVMLNAKLREKQPMLEIVKLTKSLGQRVGDEPEVWRWADDGGSSVEITFVNGRCTRWVLQRPPETAEAAAE
jgi:uncharacterized protein (DUF58 family)